jgi:hypothetical protein
MIRPQTKKILEGLKTHAGRQDGALRSMELAGRIGLPNKIVSNALNWLVLEKKHPNVRRAREGQARHWYRYWWVESENPSGQTGR